MTIQGRLWGILSARRPGLASGLGLLVVASNVAFACGPSFSSCYDHRNCPSAPGAAGEGDAGGGADAGGGVAGTSHGGDGGAAGSDAVGSGGASDAGAGGTAVLASGERCTTNRDCAGGACRDGVCCAERCDGSCFSCAAANTGQPDGACAPVNAGKDPHDDCEPDAEPCGRDGSCDGAGECRFAAPRMDCEAESCTEGRYTPAAQCDGEGHCATPESLTCAACFGSTCSVACDSVTACPSGFYCSGRSCAAKKPQGAACTETGECAAGACVEKVCCESTCGSQCNSCLQANTGQTDGKCAPVTAGLAHGEDCTAAAASTCGLDGKCDGAGACRKHVRGTSCVAQSCPAAGSTKTAARTCDGVGACMPGVSSSCGNYLCDATAATCKTKCAGNSDCSSSAYCVTSSCVAKKKPGDLCASATECSSAACSGRCCKPGLACSCTQPSAQNLLKNPGFDADLSAWSVDAGPGGFSWQSGATVDGTGESSDVDSCPFSGGAYVSSLGGGATQQRISQCVTVLPRTSYDFGVRIHSNGGAFACCALDLFPGAGCSGSASAGPEVSWVNVGWSGVQGGQIATGTASSARLSCYLCDFGDTPGAFFFDQAFLSLAPGQY